MKNIEIASPCSEDWNEMTPTQKGAFCSKCELEVLDFTKLSSTEIKQTLFESIGSRICARTEDKQFEALESEFKFWQSTSKQNMQRAMIFSFVVVFGMTLFSCTSPTGQNTVSKAQKIVLKSIEKIEPATYMAVQASAEVQSEEAKPHKDNLGKTIKDFIADWKERRRLKKYGEIQLDPPEEERWITGGMPMMTENYEDFLKETHSPDVVTDTLIPLENEVVEIEDVEEIENAPTAFLAKVYPNPVGQRTTLKIELPIDQEVVIIKLFSMSGRLVQNIDAKELDMGDHKFAIDMFDLNPGIYQLTIHTNDYSKTLQVVKT